MISNIGDNDTVDLMELLKNTKETDKETDSDECLNNENHKCKIDKTYFMKNHLIITFNIGKNKKCNIVSLEKVKELDLSNIIDKKSKSPKKFELIGSIRTKPNNNNDNVSPYYNYIFHKKGEETKLSKEEFKLYEEKSQIIMLIYVKKNE